MEPLEFEPSTTDVDCFGRSSDPPPREEVLEHYRREFADHGWKVLPRSTMDGIAATKDGVVLDVDPDSENQVVALLTEE